MSRQRRTDSNTYLEESRKWVFRLYTLEEVYKILRICRKTVYNLKKKGFLKGAHRRAGYGGEGTTFYTDRQIFEAMMYLYPDIADIESIYLAKQITEVPPDATFKERRKLKKKVRSKTENKIARELERRDRRDSGSSTGEVRSGKKGRWQPRSGGYQDTYGNITTGLSGTDDNQEIGENRDVSNIRETR